MAFLQSNCLEKKPHLIIIKIFLKKIMQYFDLLLLLKALGLSSIHLARSIKVLFFIQYLFQTEAKYDPFTGKSISSINDLSSKKPAFSEAKYNPFTGKLLPNVSNLSSEKLGFSDDKTDYFIKQAPKEIIVQTIHNNPFEQGTSRNQDPNNSSTLPQILDEENEALQNLVDSYVLNIAQNVTPERQQAQFERELGLHANSVNFLQRFNEEHQQTPAPRMQHGNFTVMDQPHTYLDSMLILRRFFNEMQNKIVERFGPNPAPDFINGRLELYRMGLNDLNTIITTTNTRVLNRDPFFSFNEIRPAFERIFNGFENLTIENLSNTYINAIHRYRLHIQFDLQHGVQAGSSSAHEAEGSQRIENKWKEETRDQIQREQNLFYYAPNNKLQWQNAKNEPGGSQQANNNYNPHSYRPTYTYHMGPPTVPPNLSNNSRNIPFGTKLGLVVGTVGLTLGLTFLARHYILDPLFSRRSATPPSSTPPSPPSNFNLPPRIPDRSEESENPSRIPEKSDDSEDFKKKEKNKKK